MKKYEVTVQETLERKVAVEAESKEAAEAMVRRSYGNSDLVLDASDFTRVFFSTKRVPNRERCEGR